MSQDMSNRSITADHAQVKPILFNTEMVRAILEGRKTVTRRVVKPQPTMYGVLETHWDWGGIKQPYHPGDILYVRETWTTLLGNYLYKADQKPGMKNPGKWRPSIHMPKEAARLFLRVTDVRVERVQDMTVGDTLCEGTPDDHPPAVCQEEISFPDGFSHWDKAKRDEWISSTARARYIGWCDYADKLLRKFGGIWDSTIKKADLPLYGWAANPWVFVIEFERWHRP